MKRIIAFGEILWDIFGNEKKIGGAPLNFSAHFTKLGGKAYMVSAVGDDENGRIALEFVKSLGMPADYISVSASEPTGYCLVTLTDGKPSYELVRGVAYDSIPFAETSGEFDAVYYGTLASRSESSLCSLRTLLKTVNAEEFFFDVNIRQNYYSAPLLDELMKSATLLKVSREEINVFGTGSCENICESLFARYDKLKAIAVTLDKDGAMLAQRNKDIIYSRKPCGKVVSTVGAGDSFSACLLYNLLCGKSPCEAMDRAVTLSDYVVTCLGAIPEYPANLFND